MKFDIYKNNRKMFRELFRRHTKSPEELAMMVRVKKEIIIQWIAEDFTLGVNQRKFHKDAFDTLKHLYESGMIANHMTIGEICSNLDISRTTYFNWMNELDPKYKKHRRMYDEFVVLYDAGFDIERITFFLRCHRASAIRFRRDYVLGKKTQSATKRTLAKSSKKHQPYT